MNRRLYEIMAVVEGEMGKLKGVVTRSKRMHEEKQELLGIYETAVAVEDRNASLM